MRDVFGTEIGVGDRIEYVPTKETYTVSSLTSSGIPRVRFADGNEGTIDTDALRWRRITPQAPDAEEVVRGFRRTCGHWIQPHTLTDNVQYIVTDSDGKVRSHVESGKLRSYRGRPLTLREVVDILAPAKDVPDPAGSEALHCYRCACVGTADGRILVYMKRRRDVRYVPERAGGFEVRAIYSGQIKPARASR